MPQPLLEKQLRKSFGRVAGFTPELNTLIELVESAYQQAEEDRQLSERAMQLASFELTETSSRLRGLLLALPDVYLHLRADGTVVECHGGTGGKANLPVWTLAGKHLSQTCLSSVSRAILGVIDEVLRHRVGRSISVETESSGQVVCYDVRIVPMASDQAIAVLQDVTDQRMVDRALKASEGLLRAIVDSAGDGIIGYDGSNRICFANLGAERLLGWRIEELQGQPVEIVMPLEVLDATSAELHEGKFRRQDETAFTAEYVRARIAAEEPDQVRGVVSFRDVTNRMQLQAQLAQAQKLEAIGQLAAGIAHEINTPTQYIGDNVRFLRDAFADVCRLIDAARSLTDDGQAVAVSTLRDLVKGTDFTFLREECPQAIAQSLDGVERVARIVSSMKEFAHPDRKEKAAVDLNRVIASATIVCRNEWKYVADLQLDLDPMLPVICGYAGDLGQVVLNLVVNAAQAIGEVAGAGSGSRGRIVVRSRTDGDAVVVEVTDNGAGIPEQVRPRIFEQFYTTKAVGKGTGQGLALVHRIVTGRHGGKVWFESTVGTGTTFFFRLPVTEQPQTQSV